MIPSRLAPSAKRLATLPRGDGRIELSLQDGFLEVMIDNPTRAGSIDPGMMLDLCALPQLLLEHSPAAVVVHSSSPVGRAFCAGGDLKSVRTHLMRAELAADMCDLMTWALDALASAPCAVIAAVEGPAHGGGAELLTACDFIYGGPLATVGFVHARLGVSPGWGGGRRLLRRAGRREALWWLTEARAVDVTESRRHGMIDELVPEGGALAAARAHAQRLTRLPQAALKGAIVLASGGDVSEREIFLSLWGGPDHTAALARSQAGR